MKSPGDRHARTHVPAPTCHQWYVTRHDSQLCYVALPAQFEMGWVFKQSLAGNEPRRWSTLLWNRTNGSGLEV
jgi:hypothetical protein